MAELKRTHTTEQIIAAPIGEAATLMGWVGKRRDLGSLVFITLRDRWGELQCTFDPEHNADAHAAAENLRGEYVVALTGCTRPRPEKEVRSYPGGDREFIVDAVTLLSKAETPPFVIEDDVKASEEMRLKYRYIDLRRRPMVDILTMRHKAVKAIRSELDDAGFLEIETPILARSTPEGARDYVVPSRVHPGKFYALPQSPQLFKQILMVSGVDKYYQIARCLRDEDLRGNRQPEHTQLDLEMSFASRDELFATLEGCMAAVWKACLGKELTTRFPRLNYDEVMQRFGTDKPDRRFGCELMDVTAWWAGTEAKFISGGLDKGESVHGVFVPGASLSRKGLDTWTETAKGFGAGGLMTVEISSVQHSPEKIDVEILKGSVSRFIPAGQHGSFIEAADYQVGTWFMVMGLEVTNLKILGQLRVELGQKFELIDKSQWEWLWVVDFPLYEEDVATGRPVPAHHAFTSPLPEHVDKLLSDDPAELLSIRADNYDLVLNGVEMCSGSLRIFDPELQRNVLRKVGLDDEQIDDRFGWFLEAYKYGAPPHRGVGFGIDRLMMSLLGVDNIREVIAFPKTATASCPLTDAPAEIDDAQWEDLGLKPRE